MKIYRILIMIVIPMIIALIIFNIPSMTRGYDVYDDGTITYKYIEKDFFGFDHYYFQLDGGMRAERVKEVSKEIYMTMREGYEYRYFLFHYGGNCTG